MGEYLWFISCIIQIQIINIFVTLHIEQNRIEMNETKSNLCLNIQFEYKKETFCEPKTKIPTVVSCCSFE